MINSLKDHVFWKYAFGKNGIFSGDLDLAFVNIKNVMRFSYMFFAVIIFMQLQNVTVYQNTTLIEPIWAMVIFQGLDPSMLVFVFQSISIIILFLIFFIPKNHTLRILFFIFFFLIIALDSSFGKISHGFHFSLLLAFFFALIPSEKVSNYKIKSILMFATAQFCLLMAYSLTGFWKLFWGVIQLFKEDVSLFSPLALRNMLIHQFEVAGPTVIGLWVMEHYALCYLFYLIAVSIELFALLIFFKANMHKIWGVLILSLHIGIELIVGVSSHAIFYTVCLLLVASPFAKQTNFKETLLCLPVISQLRWLHNKKSN
ncbi:hypothetical protein [Lacinutrix sp. Bg11-31]|uniref:hypothetical protein n=1 Tax=Lacinutrix sp. Bg11-31 TaxID=2057808 RepID=UPI000C30289F|nr:hypothetical protein [Lacinutrix sp. Bg11-31]AUC80795.1 hypothetical protein CW733_01050 [Lacinutrix sp. Bg11-31]